MVEESTTRDRLFVKLPSFFVQNHQPTNPSNAMKSSLFLFCLLSAGSAFAQAPSVVVNPDGTHSVVHSSGSSTAVIVNPNGTHSTVHNANSSTPVIVNPDGTHSVMHKSGSTGVIVNPDGTHSIVHNADSITPIIIDPYDPKRVSAKDQQQTRPRRTDRKKKQ